MLCMKKKTPQNCSVRTLSSFHELWQFLAQRWQRGSNYVSCTHFPPHL